MTYAIDEKKFSICGLAGSGKTTLLAALWSLISERELVTKLQFHSLADGSKEYLNSIARTWASATVQGRTLLPTIKHISLMLKDNTGCITRLSFPDLSGESYRRMWEERECDKELADNLQASSGFVFLVNADTIQRPQVLSEAIAESAKLGIPFGGDASKPFHPQLCPTQVKIVDILQSLRAEPLNVEGRRLCLMLSAWDKVAGEHKAPDEFLAERMPILDQYLRNSDEWEWRTIGLSAQGCDYEDPEHPDPDVTSQASEVRELPYAYQRITLWEDDKTINDLTEPLAWLVR